tara:strand:+ start:4841 stop:5830 length:990 start_codon:yes stop_codon:yes gene_type:complete
MEKILNNNRKNYSYIFCSTILAIFGTFLIINSFNSISSIKNKFESTKYAKLELPFNLHKDFYINFVPKFNNNNIDDDSINPKNFDLKDATLKGTIPFYNFETLPNELDSITDIEKRKEKFIVTILPFVVRENVEIRAKREKLFKIKKFLNINKTLSKKDQLFLEDLASEYYVDVVNKHKIDIIEELLGIVDEIPNSIVIAQAANESGWGTSRFAKEFNALFGEYTFDANNGIEPIFREEGETYLIKFFSNIDESIGSYFINLNTHLAYKEFRDTRKQLRKNNLELNPILLVNFLRPYAKDRNYVYTIKSIIKSNELTKIDNIKNIYTKS